jgi:hypothetical protein
VAAGPEHAGRHRGRGSLSDQWFPTLMILAGLVVGGIAGIATVRAWELRHHLLDSGIPAVAVVTHAPANGKAPVTVAFETPAGRQVTQLGTLQPPIEATGLDQGTKVNVVYLPTDPTQVVTSEQLAGGGPWITAVIALIGLATAVGGTVLAVAVWRVDHSH